MDEQTVGGAVSESTNKEVAVKPEAELKAVAKAVKKVAKRVEKVAKKVSKKPAKKASKAPSIKGAYNVSPKPRNIPIAGIKFKKVIVNGTCRVLGCNAKCPPRANTCATHKKQIRKAQLEAGMVKFRKRQAAGKAGHYVVFRGKPSKWALANPEAAKRMVKEGLTCTIDKPEEFIKKIDAGVAKLKAAAKKAA